MIGAVRAALSGDTSPQAARTCTVIVLPNVRSLASVAEAAITWSPPASIGGSDSDAASVPSITDRRSSPTAATWWSHAR
jgi:hypothetical protein